MKALALGLMLIHAAVSAAESSGEKPTVAMIALTGKPVKAEEIFTAGEKPVLLVDKSNTKIELAPFSVVEFTSAGQLKILRGSAVAENRRERTVLTSSAKLDFTGRALISYDHKDRSTSAFVLQGEARLVNPFQDERSLRLERFRGATLETGDVFPRMIRQLDVGSLAGWMKGYAWPDDRAREILKSVPRGEISAQESHTPKHLEETKLEDYFSSIETADEFNQPDYYDKKFADPDTVVAEANSKRESKILSPEEAALIALPSTKIDLGFEFVTPAQKDKELAAVAEHHAPSPGRSLASKPVKIPRKVVKQIARETAQSDGTDPDVTQVLERLRGIQEKSPVISQVPAASHSRSPASVESGLVPDPVYDFSENF